MGQGNEACGLELVASGVELLEGGRGLVDTGLLEDLRVDPQPVDAVNVHRDGHIVAFILDGVGDFLRQQAVPVFRFGNVFQGVGAEQAGAAPLLDVRAFDLGNARRIARYRAALEDGHGGSATATGDRTVLPGKAVFFDLRLEDIDRGFFTTGRPPVHDFHGTFGIGGMGAQRKQRGESNDRGEAGNPIHLKYLSCCYACKSGACAANEFKQRRAPGR
ncbi:hypothetical protein D3C84_467860 [compost metagenome]